VNNFEKHLKILKKRDRKIIYVSPFIDYPDHREKERIALTEAPTPCFPLEKESLGKIKVCFYIFLNI